MRENPISVLLTPEQNLPAGADLESFLATTVRKAKELSDDITLLNQDPPDGVKSLSVKHSVELLDFISHEMKGRTVILMGAYSPLWDLESTRDMLREHQELAFDFSYPENLPEGLLPDIIESDIMGFIRKTIPETAPLFSKSIKELFESDISSYDSNIFILPSRLVELRVDFKPNSWNNYLLCESVLEELGPGLDILTLEEKLRARPQLIRQRPTYYEIQLTSERESGELFLGGRSAKEGVMELESLKKLLVEISDFSKDPVVLFGFYGEPLLHPKIDEILRLLDQYPKIRFIFESRGFLNSYDKCAELIRKPNAELIVDISFSEEDSYRKHKKPLNDIVPFESLNQLVERVKALEPKESVYPQFTRSTLNEDQLMRFYQVWKEYQDRIIIKKLDTFDGAIKHLEVVDLSPVNRGFCLHLKHDILILNDGTVALNRDDVKGERLAVNAVEDGLESAWEKMGELYLRQWESGFTELEETCNCDDWWVFNF